MKQLKGKTVTHVFISHGEEYIRFVCVDKILTFEALGDCCSQSWFADLIGHQSLVGHTVTSVQELDLEPRKASPEGVPTSEALTSGDRTRYDLDKIYGYLLTTNAGHCTIAFRNSSNGYYGGELCLTKCEPKCTWREITDDWSA